jgi:hypothetical protein
MPVKKVGTRREWSRGEVLVCRYRAGIRTASETSQGRRYSALPDDPSLAGAMVPPPSACTTARLQPAGTVSCATAATDKPSWCETNLPHGSTLTPSVCDLSELG